MHQSSPPVSSAVSSTVSSTPEPAAARVMPSTAVLAAAMTSAVLAASPVALAGPADTWTLGLDEKASSATTSTALTADLAGFLIGDFDEETNPDGTLTRPGIFGGSGNQPVDLSVGVGVNGGSSADLGGEFMMSVSDAGVISLEGVELDLLGGAPAVLPLELDLLFQVFRTFNPDSLFPGGIPITLPFGDATLETLLASQGAPAIGTLTETPDAGVFDVAIVVPLVLVGEVTVLGTPVPLPPTLLPIPLTGTLTLDGPEARLNVAATLDVNEVDEGPFKGVGLTDLPFALPTVLPPGSTANVLISADLQEVGLAQSVSLALVATGTLDPGVLGDVTGDGLVDFADLLAVLANFGACEGCPEDIDGSGAVDFGDVLTVLGNWTG
ncbi:MAG: hypothetical protein AB8G96_00845 [Phycisphaerales bacterium]